jgi:hypothetical protein
MFHRRERVGDRLGFDSLEGVDQQHGALAAGKRPRDFVMEVDVPRRIDQVQFVLLAVVRVVHGDGAGLDRDAALSLDRHVVEHLLFRFALAHRAGDLHQPIGEGALAVVDVSDDRKIANELWSCHVTLKNEWDADFRGFGGLARIGERSIAPLVSFSRLVFVNPRKSA